MSQLNLFSSLLPNSSSVEGSSLKAITSQYDKARVFDGLSRFVVSDVREVKKNLWCEINDVSFSLRGFKYLETVLIWDFLYQRMLDTETNLISVTWDEICREIGVDLDSSAVNLVLKPLLAVSIAREGKRAPIHLLRTLNGLTSTEYENGNLAFEFILAQDFCSLDIDFQKAIFEILKVNVKNSYNSNFSLSILPGRSIYNGFSRQQNLGIDLDSIVATV